MTLVFFEIIALRAPMWQIYLVCHSEITEIKMHFDRKYLA
jgi:hypothetical protein